MWEEEEGPRSLNLKVNGGKRRVRRAVGGRRGRGSEGTMNKEVISQAELPLGSICSVGFVQMRLVKLRLADSVRLSTTKSNIFSSESSVRFTCQGFQPQV